MKQLIIFVSIVFLFFTPNMTEAKKFNMIPPAWKNITPIKWSEQKLKIPNWAKTAKSAKKSSKKSAWSGFWNSFKFKDYNSAKMQVEIGTLAYLYKQHSFQNSLKESWKLMRFEPFIKIQLAILDKYLQPYILMAFEKTNLEYKIRGNKVSDMTVDVDAKIYSGVKPFVGTGLQLFIIGWKNFNLHSYAQIQITSLNEAEIEEMKLTINNSQYNATNLAKDNINITHHVQRYDCGAIFSWQPLSWLTASISAGYIWFYAKIKIDISEKFATYANFMRLGDPYQLIPKEKRLDNSSFFALLNFKIKIYKRFYLNLGGMVLPGDNPLYFGQMSILAEGDK